VRALGSVALRLSSESIDIDSCTVLFMLVACVGFGNRLGEIAWCLVHWDLWELGTRGNMVDRLMCYAI
jgi:hypothetical protein